MRFLESFNALTSLLAVIDLEFRAQALRRLLVIGLAAFAGMVLLAIVLWWACKRRRGNEPDNREP